MPSAIEEIRRCAPDVVLVDVHMPEGGGPEIIRQVRSTHPAVLFLALSVSDAPEDVIGAIRAGARGYVTKTISTPELVEALHMVSAGDAGSRPASPGSCSMHLPACLRR